MYRTWVSPEFFNVGNYHNTSSSQYPRVFFLFNSNYDQSVNPFTSVSLESSIKKYKRPSNPSKTKIRVFHDDIRKNITN